MLSAGWKIGQKMPNGETRLVNNTNGGPVYVYVKDGKIVRTTPIELDDKDAPSWSIHARGKYIHATATSHGSSLLSWLEIND